MEVDESILEKINKFTRRKLSLEEVYVFSIILCDNDIDRDNECFTIETLRKLSNMFIGKTGIFDHNPKGVNQNSRIFNTEVLINESKFTRNGEVYHYIKADAYMLKTKSNQDLILEIDGGIKKEVSIGCSIGKITCSICGKDLKKDFCNHKLGQVYDNKICYKVLENPLDAYEWSFVAIPSQVNAGVIKNYKLKDIVPFLNGEIGNNFVNSIKNFNDNFINLSKSQIEYIKSHIDNLEKKAEICDVYIDDLKQEIVRLNFLTGEKIKSSVLKKVIDKMEIEELKDFKNSYNNQIDNKNKGLSSLFIDENLKTQKNNEFKI